MRDVIDELPRSDRRLVSLMAADAGDTPENITVEIVRNYLGLVRSAPAAMPNNPLRRLAANAIRKGG